MASIKHSNVNASLTVQLELNESEVRALDGMFAYNVDGFLKAFYQNMGEAYVKPYEAGVRSLHATIRQAMAGPIAQVTAARAAMQAATKK